MAVKKATKKPTTKKSSAEGASSKKGVKRHITIEPEGIIYATGSSSGSFPKTASSLRKRSTSDGVKEGSVKRVIKTAPKAKQTSDKSTGNVVISSATKNSSEKHKGRCKPFYVLRLNHLPEEFEEPQLERFLSQFGTPVRHCYCRRSRRNYRSLGTAYIQFEDASVIPTVVEECHGMLLGGKTVRARRVRRNKPMPSAKKVARKHYRALDIAAKGLRMHQHNLGRTQRKEAANNLGAVVGYLIKYSRAEKKLNERNKKALGINYVFEGFKNQLAKVHQSHFMTKKDKAAEKAQDLEEQ